MRRPNLSIGPRFLACRALLAAATALAVSACSSNPPATMDGGNGADTGNDAAPLDGARTDAATSPDAARTDGAPRTDSASPDGASQGCAANSTVACACNGGQGSRRCLPNGAAYGACDCVTYGAEVYVQAGATGGDGSAAHPYGTLTAARDAVRPAVAAGLPAGGLVVWLAGGRYEMDSSLSLGAQDSGSPERPVVWRARPGEHVELLGGKILPSDAFHPASSSTPGWDRMDPAARGSIQTLDLRAMGITDYGTLVRRGNCARTPSSALELFVDGAPMELGRWPDANANDPLQTPDATSITLYGDAQPDITGVYNRVGQNDGVGVFERVGLLNGLQYRLYRHFFTYQGQNYRAWFLTTSPVDSYPSNTDPWWYSYTDQFAPLSPAANATGSVLFVGPTAAIHGLSVLTRRVDDRTFGYAGDRPTRWATAPDAWLHGLWKYSWSDCHVPVGSIDTTARTIGMGDSPGSYGIGDGQYWYAYNLLEEVTQPGEWYLDRASGLLYLYPPHALAGSTVSVSMLATPLIDVVSAHDLVIRDVTIAVGRAKLVSVQQSQRVRLEGLTLRDGGEQGVLLDGDANAITDSIVEDTGASAVEVQGGDRRTLAGGGSLVRNNLLHRYARTDWTYNPGALLRGVGHTLSHNEIADAVHNAVLFGGNDLTIELNDIHDVVQLTSDAGAIYTGREWGLRGIVIRHNHIHDLATGLPTGFAIAGVYLDDCASGITVQGNIVRNVAGDALLLGGGRDNPVEGNVVTSSSIGTHADARGFAVINNTPGDTWNLLEKLEALGYQAEPWASRYPACAAIPDDWTTLSAPGARWLGPEGSTLSGNIAWNNAAWTNESDGAFGYFANTSNNAELTSSPFVNEAAGDYHLTATAAASVPGFATIPVDQIGIQVP